MGKSRKDFFDPKAIMQWAEAANKATDDALAKGDLLNADIPGYGRFGDLTGAKLREMAQLMRASVMFRQAELEALKSELARRKHH